MEIATTKTGTPIIGKVFIASAEDFLRENMRDFPLDGFSPMYVQFRHAEADSDIAVIIEDADNKAQPAEGRTISDLVVVLQKMATLIDNKELFVGGLRSSADMGDMENWDVEVSDAFWQLALFGEIIYGRFGGWRLKEK